jgi:serine protease
MKKVDLFFLLICSILSWTGLSAQSTDHVLGEILVQLKPEEDVHRWIEDWTHFTGRPTQLRVQNCSSPPLNIWQLNFDYAHIHELRLLSSIRRDESVIAAQFNHFVDLRATVPDDPRFDEQWQYINTGQNDGLENADLDMDLAWDITTGGLTADGDTIVVCVIDNGVNLEHEDLADNMWINHAEIPDNNIDDDLNGYVDDYRGWNVLQENDEITNGANHGTPVKGIIGAVGNNGIGVSGVNWQVKIMAIKSNFNTTEAIVISAYSYPLIQRMRYNESNGQEGAFVVATNASWGRDGGFAEDAPIWCGLYDSLGVQGIISCGATANKNVDVETGGDLPTTCPSDFLLSVTNLDRNDERVTNAGFGAVSIDLGAYGQSIYTLTRSNYGSFDGTSSATPHVAGAVALLFSAPCPTLMAIAKSDPAGAALLVRQYILDGVTPNESLSDITVSGGRLNINNSLQALMNNCQDCQPPTSVNPQQITDTSAEISWINNDSITQVDLRYRIEGTLDWTENIDVQSPFRLNGLLACTEYEFQLKAYCQEDVLEYSGSRLFKTDGCCEAPIPESILLSDITTDAATISWPSVLAADNYILRWREQGKTVWQDISGLATLVRLTGLSTCTDYEYQLVLNCSDDRTDASPIFNFNTLGCGVCEEADYCDPGSYDATGEWIAQVQIATLDNQSGSDSGYGNFTDLVPAILERGSSYPILLRTGFSDQPFSEYFQVWIDLNQDGVFLSEELVYDPEMTTKDSLIGAIEIPEDATLGSTRMRVAMRFQQAAGPCDQFGNYFGEVEDYCLEIIPATNCNLPTAFDTVAVDLEQVELKWNAAPAISNYTVRYRLLSTTNWNNLTVTDTSLIIAGLNQCSAYEAQIQSDCGDTQSIFLGNLLFNTKCLNVINEPKLLSEWQVYPNPFREQLTVSWKVVEQFSEGVNVQVLSASGQVVLQQQVFAGMGQQQIRLATGDLPAGLYLIRLTDGKRVLAVDKMVKM